MELNTKKQVFIEKPTKGRKVTKDEYNKLLREYFPEFFKNRKKPTQ